jgi:hypothetical protein
MHLDTPKVKPSIFLNFAFNLKCINHFKNKIINDMHSGDTGFASWLRYLTDVVSYSTKDVEACLNTLRTRLLNCLNARSRGLNFRHRASCI